MYFSYYDAAMYVPFQGKPRERMKKSRQVAARSADNRGKINLRLVNSLQDFATYVASGDVPRELFRNTRGATLAIKTVEVRMGTAVLFYNKELCDSVGSSQWLLIDATFDSVPAIKGVRQLLTMMAVRRKPIPFIWVVMPAYDQDAYLTILGLI